MRRLTATLIGMFILLWLAGCAAGTPESATSQAPAPSSAATSAAIPSEPVAPTAAASPAADAPLPVVYFLDAFG